MKEAQKEKRKTPKRSPAARSGDAIGVSMKDGQSHDEILRVMKARVNPLDAGPEVLTVRTTWKDEILLVLKKGGDVLAFEQAHDRAVGEKTEVRSLVSKRSLEIRDLDETVAKEEVVVALCIAMGKPDLGDPCKLYKRFDSLQAAAVQMAEADAQSLLRLKKLRVGWLNCCNREHAEVVRCCR